MKKTVHTAPAQPAKADMARALFQNTCVWYSGISLFVLLVNIILSGNESAYVYPLDFLLFFPFSLCLSSARAVRRADAIPRAARMILHPFCVLGGFALFIYLPDQLDKVSNQSPVVLLLAAAVYGAATLIIWLCNRRKKQKTVDSTPYISQFGQKS